MPKSWQVRLGRWEIRTQPGIAGVVGALERVALPNCVSLYVELLNSRIQCRTRNSKLRGRAIRASHLSVAVGQCLFDDCLFVTEERMGQSARCPMVHGRACEPRRLD